jgi:hypothetical protein
MNPVMVLPLLGMQEIVPLLIFEDNDDARLH